jgi:hypothetical protein
MREPPWRRITVTSSLNEITTDQPRIRVVVRGRHNSAHPHPNLQHASRDKFKDDVNGFFFLLGYLLHPLTSREQGVS